MDVITRPSQNFIYPEGFSFPEELSNPENGHPGQPEPVSDRIKPFYVKNALNRFAGTFSPKKDIALRKIMQSEWCPLKGTIQFSLPNMVELGDLVIPSKVFDDTVILLINNNHVALLLGGYDSDILMNPSDSNFPACEERVFSWYPASYPSSTKKAVAKKAMGLILKDTLGRFVRTSLTGMAYATGFVPMPDPGFTPNKSNSTRKLVEEMYTVPGKNFLYAGDNVNAIPLLGFDTEAMRKKAQEIKENGIFCLSGMNCSEAVLLILKSGLSQSLADEIKAPSLYATPIDIRAITEQMVNKGYVSKGEIDHYGDIWFTSKT